MPSPEMTISEPSTALLAAFTINALRCTTDVGAKAWLCAQRKLGAFLGLQVLVVREPSVWKRSPPVISQLVTERFSVTIEFENRSSGLLGVNLAEIGEKEQDNVLTIAFLPHQDTAMDSRGVSRNFSCDRIFYGLCGITKVRPDLPPAALLENPDSLQVRLSALQWGLIGDVNEEDESGQSRPPVDAALRHVRGLQDPCAWSGAGCDPHQLLPVWSERWDDPSRGRVQLVTDGRVAWGAQECKAPEYAVSCRNGSLGIKIVETIIRQ